MIRAIWNGTVIAESEDTIVVEGNHYFPSEDVRSELLVYSPHTSLCPWKGRASYYTLSVDGKQNPNAAWTYPRPSPLARRITGRIAFWHGVRIERVDPEHAHTQQPGDDRAGASALASARVIRGRRFWTGARGRRSRSPGSPG